MGKKKKEKKMKPAETPGGSEDGYGLIKKGNSSPRQRRAQLPTWRFGEKF